MAGGWAVDLFLGRVTRPHEDIEIAVLRRDQGEVRRHFSGWELVKVVKGEAMTRIEWREGEWLEPPLHEVHAVRSTGALRSLEVLLNESSGDTWLFRRNLEVTRPLEKAFRVSIQGVPFLSPEIVLLYKAKNPNQADFHDFKMLRRKLDDEQCRWLVRALSTCHQGHPWISEL